MGCFHGARATCPRSCFERTIISASHSAITRAGGIGLQATRFLVLDGAASALIVPGFALGFEELRHAVAPYIHPDDLELIICAQPIDEQASRFLPWLQRTCVTFVGIPSDRAAAENLTSNTRCGRFTYVPESGGQIALCERALTVLPVAAARGTRKIEVFDPFSQLLFDCDTGARHRDAMPGRPCVA